MNQEPPDYEVQCPVPDPETPEDGHLTKVYEMGKDGASPSQNAQETTIAQNSAQRKVGMIIPDQPDRGDEENLNKDLIHNPYVSDQLKDCSTIGDARQKLQNIVLLNVREGGKEGAAAHHFSPDSTGGLFFHCAPL